MKRLWILGLSLVGVLLAFAVQAAPGTTPAGRMKQTARPIATLAMDGPRVVYASGKKVYVWNTLTRGSSLMRGSYGAHTSEVAIAGTRVALITRYVVGNSLQTTERLYAGSVTSPARLLASGRRYAILNDGVPTTWYGRWIAGTVGSGKTLAVSTWWSARDGSCIGQRLSLVTPGGLKQIAVGPGTIMSQSSDAGRIAVLRSDEAWPIYGQSVAPTAAPTVGIYSATGALLRELTPSPAEEIALSGDRLVVLTQARTLEVYNWRTGTLVHTWPVVATARPLHQVPHVAVYGQLAVYSTYRYGSTRKLHVLRLTTGKDVVLATGGGTGYYERDAAIGPRGLVYVANQHTRGKLVFVPLAKVLRAVS